MLDLNGYDLIMTGPGAGSSGTETNGLQLLKGSTVVIKNGDLRFGFEEDSKLKMGIQNYSNLTLSNVKLSGGPTIQYVLSNNYGDIHLQNHTEITPTGNNVAFDAWYGLANDGSYDVPGVFVTLDDTVIIDGKVEFGKQGRASWEGFAVGDAITVPSDYQLDITPSSAISGGTLEWIDNGDGTKSYKYVPADSTS